MTSFQGKISKDIDGFRWLAGFAYFGNKMDSVDINRLNKGKDDDKKLPEVEGLYDKYVIEELIISPEGNILSLYADGAFTQGDERAFYIDLKKELYNKSTGTEFKIPLYRADIEGKAIYIIPLLGKGLWARYGAISPSVKT